jgi:SAM-dependent methyltransferase
MDKEKRPDDPASIRDMVSKRYAQIAEGSTSCCGPTTNCCEAPVQISTQMGYSPDELDALPQGADLGLGCGNPTAIDSIKPGETVLDLGSGAGIDVFVAAKQVGADGKVIGVDMTDAMLDKARDNARSGGYDNVEFRKGAIEAPPVEDESVDVILSNCVINLSPEKDMVFREAYRVLRRGGRLMISDIVLERELPKEVAESVTAWVACVGGASLRSEYLAAIREAGFSEIRVDKESKFNTTFSIEDPSVQKMAADYGVALDKVGEVLESVTSLHIFAKK